MLEIADCVEEIKKYAVIYIVCIKSEHWISEYLIAFTPIMVEV